MRSINRTTNKAALPAKIILFAAVVTVITFMALRWPVYASETAGPGISVTVNGTDDPTEVVPALQILLLVSLITLAPTLILLLTGFTRIIITLHFTRAAMGTQQIPPNQVLIGVALILTIYLMAPQLAEINENALQPLSNGEITIEEAIERGMEPLSRFMRDQVELKDTDMFCRLAGVQYATIEEIPDSIIIPSFVLGELTKGFIIGFVMYMVFIVIDMVVASVLMAMGMMMLPPAMISMPFKILLFLLAGGWSFVIEYMMGTFRFT